MLLLSKQGPLLQQKPGGFPSPWRRGVDPGGVPGAGRSLLLWAEGEPEGSRHDSEGVWPGWGDGASSQGSKVKGTSEPSSVWLGGRACNLTFKVRARKQIQNSAKHTIRRHPQILFIFPPYLCFLKS